VIIDTDGDGADNGCCVTFDTPSWASRRLSR